MKNQIKEYLEERAEQINREERLKSGTRNDRPCEKCGKSDFIQLYRSVVGEIHGELQGYFSLFGGDIHGYIDGYTKTLPVLSCRNCNNERLIETWKYTTKAELFWRDMYYFYFSDENPEYTKKIDPIYLENPEDTRRYMVENENREYTFYNELAFRSPGTWADKGFKIKKVRYSFLWWSGFDYPSFW